ncbi:MAG: hypothetical protein HWN65_10865 [Candidatus Helarchaeota archaeon]|nr:hypothetical protein [Candidatus Helarchaeota archaeon]
MFIIYFVDFGKEEIPSGIAADSHFRELVIKQAKKELEDLKKIDNVIKELLTSEEFDIKKDSGIYNIRFFDKMDNFNIETRGYSFQIDKEMIEKLVNGYRILCVVECTIFVPVLSAPKWVKGLVREKDFEMQVLAPGFTLDDEKFRLEITDFDSELSEALRKIAGGRLLISYVRYSQLS